MAFNLGIAGLLEFKEMLRYEEHHSHDERDFSIILSINFFKGKLYFVVIDDVYFFDLFIRHLLARGAML